MAAMKTTLVMIKEWTKFTDETEIVQHSDVTVMRLNK